MEGWKNGIMDEKQKRFVLKKPTIPLFHYSIIPLSLNKRVWKKKLF
jgi:hypothetical protein